MPEQCFGLIFATPVTSVRLQETQADLRASELLVAHLLPSERIRLLHCYCFMVTGSKGRRYLITSPFTAFNVHGEDGYQYCAAPGIETVADGGRYRAQGYPSGDILLAQKLMIEADEPSFIARANRFRDDPYFFARMEERPYDVAPA